MIDKNIAYSIIIPHYNIPKLLQRCLDSIPKRDDLQIIVVDDNSDCEIVDFDNFPGKERKDVQLVFTKESKGAGSARNVGLSYAKGEWILFADADDFFNYCINDVLDEYKENKAYDVVYFNANSLDTTTYCNTHRAEHLNAYIDLYEKDNTNGLSKLRYLFGEPWSKMVRRDLIEKNGIRFDETPIHNDTTFSYLVGFYGCTFCVDKRSLYCITVRQGSVSVTLDDNRILTRIEVFGRGDLFFKRNCINERLDWHFVQLAELFFVKCQLFAKGFCILLQLGYSNSQIIIRLLIGVLKYIKRTCSLCGKRYI